MSAVVFYYRHSEFTLRSKFTIRSVFSTGGSFRQPQRCTAPECGGYLFPASEKERPLQQSCWEPVRLTGVSRHPARKLKDSLTGPLAPWPPREFGKSVEKLRGANWGFFCPENSCVHRFGGEISSTVSKVLSDRKVQIEHKNGHQWPLIAVNGR